MNPLLKLVIFAISQTLSHTNSPIAQPLMTYTWFWGGFQNFIFYYYFLWRCWLVWALNHNIIKISFSNMSNTIFIELKFVLWRKRLPTPFWCKPHTLMPKSEKGSVMLVKFLIGSSFVLLVVDTFPFLLKVPPQFPLTSIFQGFILCHEFVIAGRPTHWPFALSLVVPLPKAHIFGRGCNFEHTGLASLSRLIGSVCPKTALTHIFAPSCFRCSISFIMSLLSFDLKITHNKIYTGLKY